MEVEGLKWKATRNDSYKPRECCTFIDNHDMGSTQNIWPFPSDKVMQRYAYILTHPGTPSIFYDHLLEWGLKEEISKLSEIRTKNGINSKSNVNILVAEADLFMAEIDDKVIMKIGPKMDLGGLFPSNFALATSGQDYVAWERMN